MKIKNEQIDIKIGNKQYSFNNLILNEYLRRFAASQLDKENAEVNMYTNTKLPYILLKFDTPLEINPNVELHNQDFDVCAIFGITSYNQNYSPNEIIIEYKYDLQDTLFYDYNISNSGYIEDYMDNKITAIGFNSNWFNDDNLEKKIPVCAVLDTSNYNIFLQSNQEFTVTRRDIITTDSIFYSNSDKVQAPAHLCPYGIPQILPINTLYNSDDTEWVTFNEQCIGKPYSIGFGNTSQYMDKEYIIGQDVILEETGIGELTINGLENEYHKYTTHLGQGLYLNKKTRTLRGNSRYLIIKYKIWQNLVEGTYDNYSYVETDTGYFYLQAIPIKDFGKLGMKIKYERG